MVWRFLIFFIFVTSAAVALELADLAFVLTETGWWLIAFLIVVYVRFFERRHLATIGLRPIRFETLWVAGAGLALAIAFVAISVSTAKILGLEFFGSQEALAETAAVSPWLLALFLFRAACVEELLFRGLLISRGLEMGGHPMQMVLISTALFVAPHAIF